MRATIPGTYAEAETIARQALAAVEAARAAEGARREADTLAAQADAMEAQAVEDLWQLRHGGPSLLARVRELTCGRMIRPTGCTHADWRENVGSHYLRADGVGADDVAEQMGMDEDSLLAAIETEQQHRPRSKADLADEARAMVADALRAREEAALDAEAGAEVAAAVLTALAGERLARVALAAARVSGDAEQVRLIVLAAQGVALVESAPKYARNYATRTFTPRRESRRPDLASDLRDRTAAAARDVRAGLALAGGMVAEFWADWAADVRRDAEARGQAARAWLGGTGRHGKGRAAWA